MRGLSRLLYAKRKAIQMIIIKKSEQIMLMKQAGKITAEALMVAREAIRPGVSTKEVDSKVHAYITKCGATPSFL